MIFLSKNLKFLRKKQGMGQGDLAKLLDIRSNTISNYENEVSTPDYNILEKIISIFHVSAHDMLYTDIEITFQIEKSRKLRTKDREHTTIASEPQAEYTPQENKIQQLKTIISDHQKPDNNLVSISMLEIYGAAGHGYMNDEKLIPTGVIDLPKSMLHSNGLRYCIRIKGHSMAPTLQDNDFLVIRHLDPGEWRSMSDEHVYLIVDKDGMAYVKRVKNRLSKGFIVLMSDSIEKRDYPNFNLQADEIASIFYAEWHFSAKMQNINETYYDRLKTLEDRVDNIENSIKQ